MDPISETDIARARIDPRFKQVLLTRALENLLATLYRRQNDPAHSDPASLRQLRDGAMTAVEVADLIRDLENETSLAESA